MKSFSKKHKNCKPTWEEPQPDMTKTAFERAEWWMQHGERGASSNAMWFYFMYQIKANPDHPLDPDDFKRCYKLLKAVPEWKSEIHKLKELSPQWAALANHWDKLTEMFEKALQNDDGREMYEFMQKLYK